MPNMPLTLVLLPGLDGTGLLFADFITALPPTIQPVLISYPTGTPLDYADLEPIVRSQLPQDQPFFLLAESFSGPLAISIAAAPPPGLLGLILCCSFATNPLPWLAPLRFALRAVPVAAIPVSLLGFFVLGRFATPARLNALEQALSLIAPDVLRTRARAALQANVSKQLAKIQMPLLYLRATEDRIVPHASSIHIHSIAAHMEITEFSAPHFLLQVLPAPVIKKVFEFMEKHRGQQQDLPD